MGLDEEIKRRFGVHYGDTLPLKAKNCGREGLARLMGETGFKTGAEIGVMKGVYSQILCNCIQGLKLKLIDPWDAFGRGTSREKNEQNMQIAIDRLKQFGGVEFIRKPSLDAVNDIPNNSLDFVYIDEMHEFDPVMMDLIQWSPKVKSGGIVSGHDFCNKYFQYGVIHAVQTYTYGHNIHNWYVTDLDIEPSFFWVKP